MAECDSSLFGNSTCILKHVWQVQNPDTDDEIDCDCHERKTRHTRMCVRTSNTGQLTTLFPPVQRILNV